jgi:hypothetical protein
MSAYPKNAERRLDQVICSLIDALGGYKVVAAACLVGIDSVNKWKQNPEASGQDIPVKHLQTLLSLAGEHLANIPAQLALEELLQDHFLNRCHRRCYPTEKVFAFIDMLQGQERKAVVND